MNIGMGLTHWHSSTETGFLIASIAEDVVKVPKDIQKYEEGRIAGARLIDFALRYVLLSKHKIKWTVTLSRWNDDWLDKEKMAKEPGEVRAIRGTFSNQ